MTPDIAQIASRLTKAQRVALTWLPVDGSWSLTRAYWQVSSQIKWFERREPVLAEAKIIGRNGVSNDLRHRLTPLGQQVRAHLIATENGS